ncbi:MAG TPA: hypothetical protein VNH11_16035 [Pirellulales bacterium]|nr:hypothetical protein [Pirellulales bacterium]
MLAITGIVKNGCVVLDEPAVLPDGSRVVVRPVESPLTFGLSESDWQDTPEAIADWIAWYDSLEPIELSVADGQAIEAFRQRQKEVGEATFDERADRLRRTWQRPDRSAAEGLAAHQPTG